MAMSETRDAAWSRARLLYSPVQSLNHNKLLPNMVIINEQGEWLEVSILERLQVHIPAETRIIAALREGGGRAKFANRHEDKVVRLVDDENYGTGEICSLKTKF